MGEPAKSSEANSLRINPTRRDYANSCLDSVDFSNHDLSGCDFRGASLKCACFVGADLSFADFEGANLYRADLSRTTLYVTNFHKADLTRARAQGALLYGVKWYDVDLTRTEFDPIVAEETQARDADGFVRAAEIYYKLRRVLRHNGLVELAVHYYVRERICRRKAAFYRHRLRWLFDYVFQYSLSGYGERLQNVFLWCAATIAISCLAYTFLPSVSAGSGVSSPSGLFDVRATASNGEAIRVIGSILWFSTMSFLATSPVDHSVQGWGKVVAVLAVAMKILLLGVAITLYMRKLIRE